MDILYEEYYSFRSSVLLRKVTLSDPLKIWSYFEAGPKTVKTPLLFLPPVCGAADVYFRQILNLSARGYRVIAVDYPQYWSIDEFCHDFEEFLDFKQFDKVHIFGTSLGGFLAQKFAEYCAQSSTSSSIPNNESNRSNNGRKNRLNKVASLILCNSFSNTMVFQRDNVASLFYLLPNFILKRMLRNGFLRANDEATIIANNFMVNQLSLMNKEQLSSRITLSYRKSKCKTSKISCLPITIIDVFDKSQFNVVSDHLFNSYPNAKKAHIKSGGSFPFLSRCDEVNLHIMVSHPPIYKMIKTLHSKVYVRFSDESFIDKGELMLAKQQEWYAGCVSTCDYFHLKNLQGLQKFQPYMTNTFAENRENVIATCAPLSSLAEHFIIEQIIISNLHLKVHLQIFRSTPLMAQDDDN